MHNVFRACNEMKIPVTKWAEMLCTLSRRLQYLDGFTHFQHTPY